MSEQAKVNEVTLDHIRQAVEWAKTAEDGPQPIDGTVRIYDQGVWDCGTSCCIWGAAHLIADNGPVREGLPESWSNTERKSALRDLMLDAGSEPDDFQSVLDDPYLSDEPGTGYEHFDDDLEDDWEEDEWDEDFDEDEDDDW